MKPWIIWSILALLSWGFFGFFPKLSVRYMRPESAIIFEALGGLVVALIALYKVDFRPEIHPQGILYAALTGFVGVMGALFYMQAATTKNVSVVAAITAVYPIITIALAMLLLRESLTWRQIAGMALALIAIWLISDG